MQDNILVFSFFSTKIPIIKHPSLGYGWPFVLHTRGASEKSDLVFYPSLSHQFCLLPDPLVHWSMTSVQVSNTNRLILRSNHKGANLHSPYVANLISLLHKYSHSALWLWAFSQKAFVPPSSHDTFTGVRYPVILLLLWNILSFQKCILCCFSKQLNERSVSMINLIPEPTLRPFTTKISSIKIAVFFLGGGGVGQWFVKAVWINFLILLYFPW